MQKIFSLFSLVLIAVNGDKCPSVASMVEDVVHSYFEIDLMECSDAGNEIVDSIMDCMNFTDIVGSFRVADDDVPSLPATSEGYLECFNVTEILSEIQQPLQNCYSKGLCSSQHFSELWTDVSTCDKTTKEYGKLLVDEFCGDMNHFTKILDITNEEFFNCTEMKEMVDMVCEDFSDLCDSTPKELIENPIYSPMLPNCPAKQPTTIPTPGPTEPCPSLLPFVGDLAGVFAETMESSTCQTLVETSFSMFSSCAPSFGSGVPTDFYLTDILNENDDCFLGIFDSDVMESLQDMGKQCALDMCTFEVVHEMTASLSVCNAGVGSFVGSLFDDCPLENCKPVSGTISSYCDIGFMKPICDLQVSKMVQPIKKFSPDVCSKVKQPTPISAGCPAISEVYRAIGAFGVSGCNGVFTYLENCPNQNQLECITQEPFLEEWKLCRKGVCAVPRFYEPMTLIESCPKPAREFLLNLASPVCSVIGCEDELAAGVNQICSTMDCNQPMKGIVAEAQLSCKKENGGPGVGPQDDNSASQYGITLSAIILAFYNLSDQ